MSAYSDLNITIRRVDRKPISQKDLEIFTEFFHDDNSLFSTYTYAEPHVCSNGTEAFASCQIKHTLEPADVLVFTKENPYLQMEIYESCDDEDVGETRYLFEGPVLEILNQSREFEEPSKIDWPLGQVVVPEDKIELARCANEEGFYEWLGSTIRDILSEDREPEHSLGQIVTSAYLGGSCEDVFRALVGWSMSDLLERWKEFKDWQNEDSVVAEGAKKILEEGLF